MSDLAALKDFISVLTGIHHDGLQLLASLALSLGSAAILRRPISHPLPWLSVLALQVAHELFAGFGDGNYQRDEVAQSGFDIIIGMIVPSILLLFSRYAPQLMCPRRVEFIVPLDKQRARREVIEADFREVRGDASSSL